MNEVLAGDRSQVLNGINSLEIRLTSIWLPILWTCIIFAAIAAVVTTNHNLAFKMARKEAVTAFEKDVLFREWASMHGGVYVPVTPDTHPNPYLSGIPDRDIGLKDGTKLTLVNPVYLTQEAHEIASRNFSIKGHLTSLRPLKPHNAPDAWETEALYSFENGQVEATTTEQIDGELYFRFMQPLITQASCLKCHSSQDNRAGAILGGISVSVPLTPFFDDTSRYTLNISFLLIAIWLLGLGFLTFITRALKNNNKTREEITIAIHSGMQKLQESEARFRVLVENATEAIVVIDFDLGLFVDFNMKACELFKLSPEEIVTKSPVDLSPEFQPDGRSSQSRGTEAMNAAAAGECPRFEWTHIDNEGNEFPCEVQLTRLPASDRTLIRGSVVDITNRKAAEEALRRSENQLSSAIEIAKLGHWEYDVASDHFIFNDQFYNMLRTSVEQVGGYTMSPKQYAERFIHPDDRYLVGSRIHKSLASPEYNYSRQIEHRAIFGDGSSGYLAVRIKIVRNDFDEMIKIYGVNQDISEQKMLEAQLRQAMKLEAIGTLAGGIAHDFNNILHSILGNTELAKDTIGESNSAYEYLEEVTTASHRAAGLVKQILTFARKTAKKRDAVNAAQITKEVARLLKATVPASINLTLDIDTDETTVEADPTEIHQVLMNLCTNSSQAIVDASGDITIRLATAEPSDAFLASHPTLQRRKHLVIAVSDTGPGIPPEQLQHIFDPFFTTKEQGRGTGLGLAVVHGIVKDLSGTIEVDSVVGTGTCFRIYLPLSSAEAQTATADESSTPTGTESILAVDDEAAIATMLSSILKSLGYSVTTCTSGREALELYRGNPGKFDLVLSDQTMPMITGAELATEIRALHPKQPIILCSGYSQTLPQEKAELLGISAYVTKPVSKHDLAVTIRRVLDDSN